MTKARKRSTVLFLVGLAVPGIALATPAYAQQDLEGMNFTATIDGRDLAEVDANEALRLQGEQETLVRVEVRNDGTEEVFIRSIRLDGKVMGLTFFSYETRVDLRVEPAGTGEREFVFDLIDLGGQANGLLPARLTLLDEERQPVSSQSFPADVRGSLASVYGVFGLGVAAITALLLAASIIRLATHRLSLNRWRRGIRFGVPGLGLGLTLTFTLSTLRVLTPSADKWVALVLVFGAAMFIVGFCTPTPETGDEDDEEDELLVLDDYEGLPTVRRHLVPTVETAGAGDDTANESEPEPGNTTVRQEGPPPPPLSR
jgi:hypothetical protein